VNGADLGEEWVGGGEIANLLPGRWVTITHTFTRENRLWDGRVSDVKNGHLHGDRYLFPGREQGVEGQGVRRRHRLAVTPPACANQTLSTTTLPARRNVIGFAGCLFQRRSGHFLSRGSRSSRVPRRPTSTVFEPPVRRSQAQANRRRHMRFPLGLPARLHRAERPGSIVVEIVDVSATGLRLRSLADEVLAGDKAALRFVLTDQRICAVAGRVTRVERDGVFVLALDEANHAFHSFVASLSADGP